MIAKKDKGEANVKHSKDGFGLHGVIVTPAKSTPTALSIESAIYIVLRGGVKTRDELLSYFGPTDQANARPELARLEEARVVQELPQPPYNAGEPKVRWAR